MIGIYKKHEDAQFPIRASERAVGYDLFAYYKTETGRPNKILISPQATRLVPTGLVVVPPDGYSIFVAPRSGLAIDRTLTVLNAPGVIDPDYRGELMVMLYNGGHVSQYVEHGQRVGQMILLPFKPFDFYEVKELDKTERGDKGFGSTGR